MSTKSALRADLDAEDRKTLAGRPKANGETWHSQLDDWLAFGPGLSTAAAARSARS
jgi:hypothetical protein